MIRFLCLLAVGLIVCLQSQVDASSRLSRSLIEKAVNEAKASVDAAYTYSRQESLKRVQRNAASPADVLRLLKQPAGPSRQAVRAADYMANALSIIKRSLERRHKRSLNATDLVSDNDLEVLERLTGCSAQRKPSFCYTITNLNTFRTAGSVCNNL